MFFNLRNPSSRITALGLTQPLTEMSSTNYLEELNLKAIYEQPSVGQSVSVSGSHPEPMTRFFMVIAGFLRAGLSFTRTVASGPCQSSHSRVQVPRNSRPYFTVWFETSPTWRARSPYLHSPGTGWHWFCRLLRLAGLRRRYSNPPPDGVIWLIVPTPDDGWWRLWRSRWRPEY
jgi:hypothetical protein